MSNPFHSFHVQSGGVHLNNLSKYYRRNNNSKNNSKFQPLMLQENKDLVVPMDLLHVPPTTQYHCQTPNHDNYYIFPEPQSQPPLEIIQIHVQPQQQEYKHYPVLDDEQFDQMFVNISTTPKASSRNQTPKSSNNKVSRKKKPKTPKNTKKGKSKRTFKNLNKTSK
jgi:hypothetical protein